MNARDKPGSKSHLANMHVSWRLRFEECRPRLRTAVGSNPWQRSLFPFPVSPANAAGKDTSAYEYGDDRIYRLKHAIGHFEKSIILLACPPQILLKHCFQFLLGLTMVPREKQNIPHSKFGGTNKKYYSISRSGLFILRLFYRPYS